MMNMGWGFSSIVFLAPRAARKVLCCFPGSAPSSSLPIRGRRSRTSTTEPKGAAGIGDAKNGDCLLGCQRVFNFAGGSGS